MKYEPDIFYSVDHLSRAEMAEIFEAAKAVSTDWRVDQLGGDLSHIHRTGIEMSWEDTIDNWYLRDYGWGFFIHRRGYPETEYGWKHQLEVGYRVHDGRRDLFLWIHAPESEIPVLVERFGLAPIELPKRGPEGPSGR